MSIKITNGPRARRRNGPHTRELFEGAYLAGPYHDPENDEYSWTLWTWLEGRDLEKAQDAALDAVGSGADFIDEWEPMHKSDARRWLLDIRDEQEFPGEPARPDWARINIMKTRRENRKPNSRSAPDKYGDRTGYHMSLSYGQLPKKAEFERIWEDEMGSSSYRWDLKNRDGDVVSAAKDEFQDKYPALKGVTDSGIRDADAAWVLLHALKRYHEEPGEPEDSEDMSAEEIEEWQNEWAEEAGNLASALLETLGIEWV